MKKTALIVAFLFCAANVHADDGVILLHGLLRTDTSMQTMEERLRDAGFTVVNVDYPSRSASVQALSEKAIGDALQDARLEQCEKIHFVTHSLGGIMVRSYLKHHKETRLGRVVMLCPPNRGSEVVDVIGDWWLFRKVFGPAGCELGTDNASVPNTLGAVDFELGVIAGDRSIDPIGSAMIEGPDDGRVSIERTRIEGMAEHTVVHATHPFITKNDAVIEKTILFLTTGSFTPEKSRSAD
jgi:pimeloyl-ACP methyl ester carboxylesterase